LASVSRFTVVVLAMLFFGLSGRALGSSLSPQELTAFSQGQAYERLFQDHIMPGTCGIVLERPRCLSDFRAIQSLRGNDPTDAAMEAWLATGDLTKAVKDWNGSYVPEKAWTETPDFAWWYTAGQVSIAASLPINDATTEYLAHLPDFIVAHAAAVPPDFKGLVAGSGSPFERLRPLQVALLKVVPTTAYPQTSFDNGVKGDAQLGAYLSTLQELVDNPLALSRPESRAFGLIVAQRLQSINDRYVTGASFSAVVTVLSGNIPDPEGLNGARQALSNAVSTKWPRARREALILGAVAAQVAYNAAVLRDPQSDAEFRGAIGKIPPYEGMSAQVRADLAALKNLPATTKGGDWDAINAAASRAASDIAQAP
jgi:hypothetical protein